MKIEMNYRHHHHHHCRRRPYCLHPGHKNSVGVALFVLCFIYFLTWKFKINHSFRSLFLFVVLSFSSSGISSNKTVLVLNLLSLSAIDVLLDAYDGVCDNDMGGPNPEVVVDGSSNDFL